MTAYPLPDHEAERQQQLESFQILDAEPDEDFDRITRIASQMLGMPIALISLVDHDRQWFLSRVGLAARETAREVAFCAHTICSDGVMVVADARDDGRFRDNPLVTGAPHIRFYAGAPLRTRDGHALGTLCVISSEPRQLGDNEHRLLEELAGMVIHTLESRRDRYLCPLTGLQNRRPFFEAGERELQRSRESGVPLSLSLVVLDDFASLSDRLSRAEANRLLQELAEMVRSELGASEVAARVAAAEFAVLLCGQPLEAAIALADRICSRIVRKGVVVDGVRQLLAVRSGSASRLPQDSGFSDLYQRAEAGLIHTWLADVGSSAAGSGRT
jgi:diguanylate cyclase (GGDEF)-like protein